MALYDRRCAECAHVWEVDEPMLVREDAVEPCPECGCRSSTRLLGSPPFVLRGSGWARDGYGN